MGVVVAAAVLLILLSTLLSYCCTIRVYVVFGRPSVCLSVPSFARHCCGFAAVGPAGTRYLSIAARPAFSSSGAVTRRLAANAGSVTLSADVGSWTPTCWNYGRNSVFTRWIWFWVLALHGPKMAVKMNAMVEGISLVILKTFLKQKFYLIFDILL